MPTTRLQATTSGQRYHIQIAGAGQPLLLLHGFSGASANWQSAANTLANRSRLIILDSLGHGNSDAPHSVEPYRMDALAADITNLLDQLEISQTHLLGYSMGGRLALYLALRYPERLRSLILESASPGLADDTERARRRQHDERLANKIEARGINWFVDYWERLPLWASQAKLPAEILGAQRQQRLRNSALGLANSLRGLGTGVQPNLWPHLPTLQLPALLLAGAADDKFRRVNQAMAARMPQAQPRLIPSAGHNTHLENPQAFYREVSSFLASI